MRFLEDLELHDELNPKLWKNKQLLPEVKAGIIKIVKQFEKDVQAPIDILDVQILGSQASFNYTSKSDLDVHLIANFDTLSKDPEVLGMLYDSERNNFNKKYDFKIKGIKVELYVQDVKSNVVSNGIYSLSDNKWIKEPKPIKSISIKNTEKELEKWKKIIADVLSSGDSERIKRVINTLYLIRHNSIAIDGETGKGNMLFKEIRSKGYLDRLKDASYAATSKELTVESFYSDGQLVNRLDEE